MPLPLPTFSLALLADPFGQLLFLQTAILKTIPLCQYMCWFLLCNHFATYNPMWTHNITVKITLFNQKLRTGGGLRRCTVALKSSPACVNWGNDSIIGVISSAFLLKDLLRPLPSVKSSVWGVLDPAEAGDAFGEISVSRLIVGLKLLFLWKSTSSELEKPSKPKLQSSWSYKHSQSYGANPKLKPSKHATSLALLVLFSDLIPINLPFKRRF